MNMTNHIQYVFISALLFLSLLWGAPPTHADILTVGPGYTYSTINAAYTAASSDDSILVYPQAGGTPYSQPALNIYKANISIIGQAPNGDRIQLDGSGYNYSGAGSIPRAMFQFNSGGDGGRVANFEISNCRNNSYNGAAVRINQANNIVIENCNVHNCDMGFMSNGSVSSGTATNQLIKNCLVHDNGSTLHLGYSHNFYMGGDSVTLRGCNVHSSTTGHNVKSRAHLTIIEGCYIHDSANRELDLVDDSGNTTVAGSHALIKGSTIVKDPAVTGNRTVIHFGQDGGYNHNGTLHIINCTIVTPFISAVVHLSAPDARTHLQNTLVIDPTGNQGNQVLVYANHGASLTNSSGSNLWLSYGLTTPATGSFTNTTIGARYYIPPFHDITIGDYRLTSSVADIVNTGNIIDDRDLPLPFRLKPLMTPTPLLGSQIRIIQEQPDLGAFEWNNMTQIETNIPPSPVRLLFVHHSCGNNWLNTGNGNLGNRLGQNNYYVRDTYYGWDATLNPNIGSSTDIGHWYNWFANTIIQSNGTNQRDNIMGSLYTTSNKNASYDSTICPDPGGENDIIMFKSCYPNSKVNNNNSTNPQDLYGQTYTSSAHTLENCKAVYNKILNYMKTRDDKMFVIITAPPLLSSSSTLDQATNARILNNWLINDWLFDANWMDRNVFVFDLYNTLTETNNHHRVNNSTIEHITTNGNDYAGPYCSGGDNHPTATGNQKATAEFVPLLNVFYNRWMTRRDAVDHDGDGMSDRWEIFYAGDTSMQPEEDTDSDTLSNIEELIAGTDPTNNLSKLTIEASYSNGSPRINFLASEAVGTGYAGRTRNFTIQQTSNLLAPTWADIPGYSNITGTGQQVIYTPPTDQSRHFYLLKSRLE